mmetsp:Transcript_10947/g.32403  ORF Transcript_10947/g.32403 Transcript_10947/m.32403 type:complete len:207 (+) Transcript_10947:1032-1652(+)
MSFSYTRDSSALPSSTSVPLTSPAALRAWRRSIRPFDPMSSPSLSIRAVPTTIKLMSSDFPSSILAAADAPPPGPPWASSASSVNGITSMLRPCSHSSSWNMSTTFHPVESPSPVPFPASTSHSSYTLLGMGGAPPSPTSTPRQSSRSISSTHSCSTSNPPRSASTCLWVRAASRSSLILRRSSDVRPSSFRLDWSVSVSRDTRTA